MTVENKFPLKGKRVVITRSQDQQAEAKIIFSNAGANVLDLPALVIGPPTDWSYLDNALLNINDFDWVVFSSSNGVNSVEKRLQTHGNSLSTNVKNFKIASVGKKTAFTLNRLGIQCDFIPPEFVAESLIENFPFSNKRNSILLPRVESGGRSFLSKSFREAGCKVLEVPAYQSSCPDQIPADTLEAFESNKIDAISFTSGKTVVHTCKLLKHYFGSKWKTKILDIKIISIGPQTSLMCKKYFDRVDEEAKPYDLEGLTNACIKSFNIE